MSDHRTHPSHRTDAPALRTVGLTLAYDGRPVVAGLDLEVRRGEILVVLGSSGCGKSTLLRAFAGLHRPVGGRIEAAGDAVTGPGAERALVFQDDALLPWRSVRRNVELPLAVRRVPRQERRRRAAEWLGRVGLADHAERLPRQLSGGMRQRAQLARALAGAPAVVLMDEPFGALDAQTRGAMQRLLVETWRSTGATIVFVTHDVDEALVLGDRIVVLRDGRTGEPGIAEFPVPRPRDFDTPADTGLRGEILAVLGVAASPERAAA